MPIYRWTLHATQLRDVAPGSIAWLRAALISPHYTRQLMYWLPTMLSGGLPPHLQPMMNAMGQAFDARPVAGSDDPAANT